jgi:hypothetical protein
MTIRTLDRSVGACQRKLGPAVVKRCAGPLGCGVAQLAILRKFRGCVIWIRCSGVLIEMTRHTSCAGASELPLLVTCGAHNRCMRSHQGKAGSRVIKRRRFPRRCSMTQSAILRKSSRDVVRIRRRRKRSAMTGKTTGWCVGELIPRMTVGALGRGMSTAQREACAVVVKRRPLPPGWCVTQLAVLRKTRSDMIRVRCCCVIADVA